jgi:superfamily I DNA/RNA helicase
MMLDSSPSSLGLTEQQCSVVEAPINTRQLIVGGAGTGKTHVLVGRIRYLIASGDLAPASELLVLSFTRAVVGELRARVRSGEGDLRLVRPFTFDSFATRLLYGLPEAEVGSLWRESGYDGRVSSATTAIHTGEEAAAAVASYRHVLVDETQDLVGVRAHMVLEILRHVEGFTVLGDPAQSIYDYQLRGARDATSSQHFFSKLRSTYTDLSIVVLQEDFRTRHAFGEPLAHIGATLRDPRQSAEQAREPLFEMLRSLDHVGSFEDLPVALRGTRERTAVLCRTNAECLEVSRLLFREGIDHRLQEAANERLLPAWVARLFCGVERRQWSSERLEQLIEKRRSEGAVLPPTNAVVGFLTDAVGDDSVALDVLHERVGHRVLPDHLYDLEDVPVVVSTVHRAKGLEFDRVFFGVPRNGVPEDAPEELRVLYVALSRSREDLWSFEPPRTALWHKPAGLDDRWVKWPWQDPWKTLGWEVRSSDIDTIRPPGAGFAQADPLAVQRRLAEGLPRGTPVVLKLIHVRKSDEPIPFYAALADDRLIGETNEAFGLMLLRRLGQRNETKFPRQLREVFVSGFQTAVGSQGEGEAAGLGISGMWLRPRIVGLSYVDWAAG